MPLVTGAAGFAGRHLLEHLAARQRRGDDGSDPIVAWARALPADPTPGVRWQSIDLEDREAVHAAVRRLEPTAVYHCAGFPHASGGWSDAVRPLAANVLMTHYLLDALRLAGGGWRILLPGSATVYAAAERAHTEDDPLAPPHAYGLSKLAQEQLGLRAVVEDGLEVIVTRSFNHTGPRQTPAFAAASMARQVALIERGELPPVVRVGNLDARRDLTDVRDVVAAYAALMRAGTPGTVYNVASGTAQPIRAVLDGLIRRSRVTVTVEPDPARMRPADTPVVLGDASRLHAATGWTPTISFDRMLDDLLDYWRTAA